MSLELFIPLRKRYRKFDCCFLHPERINVFQAVPFHCSPIPNLKEKHLAQWKLSQHRAATSTGERRLPLDVQITERRLFKKDTVATRHRHSHALAGDEEPQSAGTKGKEKHTPLVPNSLCVWPEQPLLIIFLRGNPLNTLPFKSKAGDACGGSPGDAL